MELLDVDVQFVTEIDGGGVDFRVHHRRPEMELISTCLAAVTIVDVPLDIYRECGITFFCGRMLRERTCASPLSAAAGRRLEVH
jgi:hypothetical protein